MERYTVTIVSSVQQQQQLSLAQSRAILVPFSPTSTIGAFIVEVKKRAVRHGSAKASDSLELYFGAHNGPFMDPEDALGDVVLAPATEAIFAVFRRVSLSAELIPLSAQKLTSQRRS